MKLRINLFLTACLILVGCKNNSVEPPPLSSDEQLNAKLIGTWKYEIVSTIQFIQGGTFIDSSLITPYTVVHGQYSVNEGLLTFSNCQIAGGDTMSLPNGLIGYIQKYLASFPKFSKDTLLLNRVDVFSQSSGNISQLNGTWISNTWVALVGRWPLPSFRTGVLTSIYEFFPDSARYHLINSYSLGTTLLNVDSTGSYLYSPPHLSIANGLSINVEFSQGKMYWTYGGDPKEYKKIN